MSKVSHLSSFSMYNNLFSSNLVLFKITVQRIPYRDDNRCGGEYFAPNGAVAICNADGEYPCCSSQNWCGNTSNQCECHTCIDYRLIGMLATVTTWMYIWEGRSWGGGGGGGLHFLQHITVWTKLLIRRYVSNCWIFIDMMTFLWYFFR